MNTNGLIRNALAIAALVLASVPAQATPVTWTLSGIFNDGATASGSFVWDADTNTSPIFSISTTGGTLGAFTYDNSSSYLFAHPFSNANDYVWAKNDVSRYIDLDFATPLTNAGGTHALLTANPFAPGGGFQNNTASWECDNCASVPYFVEGSVTSVSAVPEPETYAMMLAGLGLLGFAARRRKQKEQAAA